MDVFCDAREVMRRYERYVIDLRRLFLFHGLPCGAAENFCDLALKLEESRALRLDLPALLRNIRDLEQEQLTADEMLTVVALASGGEELVDGRAGSAGLMRTVGLLQMMLAGVGTWSETGGDDRAAKAVTSDVNTGEERVFLELAIEELRLQLGEVTRRMSQLEPLAVAGQAFEAPVVVEAPADLAELPLARGMGVSRQAEMGGVAVADVVAPADARAEAMAAEADARAAAAAARWEAAEREAAEAMAAAAAKREAFERERVRVWPLEERVSPLPALPKKRVMPSAAMLEAAGAALRRGKDLRLAGVAAGLLLATVGIYGSLRSSGTGAAEKTNAAKDSGRASESLAATPAVKETAAAPAESPAGVAKEAAESAAGMAPGTVKAPAATGVSAAKVVKIAPPVERKPAVVAAAPEVTAKNRRDDAAVEAALAVRPRGTKFLFVPADVMEKHLLSARKPIVPAEATKSQGPARVVLNAFIAKDGTVSRTDVVEGPPTLINSAMAAVSWRRYRPFLVRGQPAEVVTPVTVSYAATP